MLKVFLQTYGCQMNVRDSEVVCGLLKNAGYAITDDPVKADVVLINTCSVRQHAEEKVWSEIGRLTKGGRKIASSWKGALRNDGGNKPFIGIIGCMAKNYAQEVFERAPAVDFVVGPADIGKIPGIIAKLMHKGIFESKIWETEGETRPEDIYHTGFHEEKEHAFVVISEGCSNFCSYCVVPYVRGPLRHRAHQEIVKEITQAVDKGITRFTLLGQNVNAYYDNTVRFIDLVELVDKVGGLKEFSFITSHPKDASAELFRAMQRCSKMKKYLHLPVQAGSDRILQLMNRAYSRTRYLDLVKEYRTIVPGGVLTTDIIVGFPSETEEEFMDTYALVHDVQFDAAFIFKYSPRPHTHAAQLMDDVPKAEKERRHQMILQLQKEISAKIKAKGKSTRKKGKVNGEQ